MAMKSEHAIESQSDGQQAAMQFWEELLGSVDTLGEIAETYGVRTLTDLMHLHVAVLTGGFIDAWAADSSVLNLVQQLPSSQHWLRFITVYDEHGSLVGYEDRDLEEVLQD